MSLSIGSSTSSAPVSFTGIASGINSTSIIQAEQAPETAVLNEYQSEIGTYTNANTAWQTILTDLQAIGSQVTTLQDPLTFQAMGVQSSNSSALTASASAGAPAGSYQLTVGNLAQGQESVSAGSVSDPTALDFGTGTLSIQVGTGSPTVISIGSGQNSLNGIAAAINGAGIGVTAQVAETGDGTYQLLLTGNQTGAANGFTVTDNLSGGGTALGPFGTVQAAADAHLTLGSGSGALNVTSASNTVTSLLPGVSLSLLSPGTSTVTVSPNSSSEAASVQNFVTAYNQLVKDINTQNTYNTSTDTPGGPLFGNPLLNLVAGTVSEAVTSPVAGAPEAVNSLAMIGVSMNNDGTLSVNNSTLQSALQQDPQGVQTLMQGVAQATSTALSSLDATTTGAVPEQITANQSEIQDLTTTVKNMQAQMQQEELIQQQMFAAMEQVVSQNQGLLTLLAGETALLDGSSSSTSSTGSAANAANSSSGSGSGSTGG